MGGGSIKNVYLTGWEYNRLLQDDPFVPRSSALPAEVLWNGAAHFWLYETVYCTPESLNNEYDAANILGWTTGHIFAELQNEGIVQAADWGGLDDATRLLVNERHRKLRQQYSPEEIRQSINDRRFQDLEAIKVELVQPIAAHYQCEIGIGPSSLKQPRWKTGSSREPAKSPSERARSELLLNKIASPISRPSSPNGIVVCRSPGSGIAEEDRRKQEDVQRQFEMPEISALLAGDGEYAGSRGWIPYQTKLEPHRNAYGPINAQLKADWDANKGKLLRLRAAAEKYLWPSLHGEWLPALYADPAGFAREYGAQLDRVFRYPKFRNLLNMQGNLAWTVAAAGSYKVAEMLSLLANLPPAVATVVGVGVAGLSIHETKKFAERRAELGEKSINDLLLFYQKAKAIV